MTEPEKKQVYFIAGASEALRLIGRKYFLLPSLT
jgi:hypothetical protein